MLPKSSLRQGIQNSFDIDEVLDDTKLSFLVDNSIKREFYYEDPLNEGQVYQLRKSFKIGRETSKTNIPSLQPINEMTRTDILRGADAARIQRSKDKRIIVQFIGVTEINGWLRFRVTSQFTPGKSYLVHIKLKDAKDIKYFKDFKKRDIIRLLLNGDLAVNCSCPDFRFRHRYQAYQMGYSLFKELRYPHITNPGLEGTVCKHLLATLRLLTLQWLPISKAMQASKFFKNKYEEDDNIKTVSRNKKPNVPTYNRGRRIKGTH